VRDICPPSGGVPVREKVSDQSVPTATLGIQTLRRRPRTELVGVKYRIEPSGIQQVGG